MGAGSIAGGHIDKPAAPVADGSHIFSCVGNKSRDRTLACFAKGSQRRRETQHSLRISLACQ